MKAQLGKPTGLALALLAALLATFFAMGVFSVAQAQTQTSPSAERSFSDHSVTTGEQIVVTIQISGYVRGGAISRKPCRTGSVYVSSSLERVRPYNGKPGPAHFFR